MPEGEEWATIDGLISILKPFQKATKTSEKYSTLSTVKPLLFKLFNVTLKSMRMTLESQDRLRRLFLLT